MYDKRPRGDRVLVVTSFRIFVGAKFFDQGISHLVKILKRMDPLVGHTATNCNTPCATHT